jgi:hypothetical protein
VKTPSSQRNAVLAYRRRLRVQGVARFEVMALDEDRELIRSTARCLAERGKEGVKLREAILENLPKGEEAPGRIWEALRRSPLVGENLNLRRSRGRGRKVVL